MTTDPMAARLVAQLVAPDRRIEGVSEPAPERYAELCAACERHKIPLLSLDGGRNGFAAGFYASNSFQAARQCEQERLIGLQTEYLIVREALASRGIRDVLIKSADLAPALPYKSDNLDILVAEEHGAAARAALLALGYIEVRNVEEPHKFLFRKFHLGSSISAIHLHEFVGWGTGFMNDARVLAQARPSASDPRLLVPCREDALLIIMAHAFYEDKEIKLGDLWKVMHLLREGELDWEAIYRQVGYRGWREGLDTCIGLWSGIERALYGEASFPSEIVQQAHEATPDYSHKYLDEHLAGPLALPVKVPFRFSKKHYYRKVWHDEALSPRQKYVDAMRHSLAGVRRRLPFTSQRGMLITFSGIDGSGKTVQAESLAEAFRTCEIDARTVWSRGASSKGTDRVIRLVKTLLVRRNPQGLDMTSDTREAKLRRKGWWLRQPLLRLGWVYLNVFDLIGRYWRQVLWPLAWGRVVVADRYTYDALVELAVLAGRREVTRSLAAWLLRTLCPRPRLAYFLHVSPDAAMARKPDEVMGFLREQAAIYQQQAPAWGLRVVDANQGLGETVDNICAEALGIYYDGWRTLINALFWANPIKRS